VAEEVQYWQSSACTRGQTLSETLENLVVVAEQASLPEQALRELVADRGYHSGAVLQRVEELGLRSLHRRAQTAAPEVARPDRRAEGHLCQSSTDEGGSRQESLSMALRESGAQHGAQLRDGRPAAPSSARFMPTSPRRQLLLCGGDN
jgi:hypothetical protein